MQYQVNAFNPAPNGPVPTPAMPEIPTLPSEMDSSTPPPLSEANVQSQTNETFSTAGINSWNGAEWNMISLGLEEPLPAQDVIDEL